MDFPTTNIGGIEANQFDILIPGGGVGAVVGHNAAREILKDLGK